MDATTLKEWHEYLSYAKDFAEDNGAEFRLDVKVPREREKVIITKYFERGEGK